MTIRYEQAKEYIIGRLRRELPSGLFYHGLGHTLDVLNAASEISERERVDSERDLILLKTAALFHDAGYIEKYYKNEPIGCRMVADALPEFGYSREDISIISEMILATAIPQKPNCALAEILCDADLDYLGRDDFFLISEKLREELAAHDKIFSDDDWIRFEIRFLEGHTYFTDSERKLREPLKRTHLERLRGEVSA